MRDGLTKAELALLKRVRAEGALALGAAGDLDGELVERLTATGFLRGLRSAGDTAGRTYVLSGEGVRAAARPALI